MSDTRPEFTTAELESAQFTPPVRRLNWIFTGLLLVTGVSCVSASPDINTVTDGFSAPTDWQLLSQDVVNETLCQGAGCETVVIAWSSEGAPDAVLFESLMQEAGWEEIQTNSCQVRENATGPIPFCRATASSKQAQIELTASGPMDIQGGQFRMTLRVSD